MQEKELKFIYLSKSIYNFTFTKFIQSVKHHPETANHSLSSDRPTRMELSNWWNDKYRQDKDCEIRMIQDGDVLIGYVTFQFCRAHHRCELTVDIHPDYWHKGYEEAILSWVENALKEFRRIQIKLLLDSYFGEYCVEAGLKREGILRNYASKDGKSYDAVLLSLIQTS